MLAEIVIQINTDEDNGDISIQKIFDVDITDKELADLRLLLSDVISQTLDSHDITIEEITSWE